MNRGLRPLLMSVGILLIAALAAWAIWNAAAGARLRRALADIKARGWPMTLEDFRPPAVPDADNAAPILNRAFLEMAGGDTKLQPLASPFARLMEEWSGSTNAIEALRSDPARVSQIKSRMETPEVASVIGLLRQAATRPACNFNLNYAEGAALLLPHVVPFRSAVRLLSMKAFLEASDGRTRESLALLHDAWILSDMVKEDCVLISLFVSIACDQTALESLSAVLAAAPAGSWTAADLDRLAADLTRKRAALRPALARSMDAERIAMGGWAFEAILDRKISALDMLDGGGDSKEGRWTFRLLANPLRPLLKADYAEYLRRMTELRQASERPFDRADMERIRQDGDALPRWAFISRLVLPALGRARVKVAEHECLLDVARTGLALERHRLETGAYPASLDELRLPGGVPADPFTGRPLMYKPSATGVVVYGAGENGEDDGGRRRTHSDGSRAYDLVWEVTR